MRISLHIALTIAMLPFASFTSAKTNVKVNNEAARLCALIGNDTSDHEAIMFLDSLAAANPEQYAKTVDECAGTIGNVKSEERNDRAFATLLRHASTNAPDEATRARSKYLLKISLANAPGTTAPDFELQLADGSETTLHSLLKKDGDQDSYPFLLFFYDPACDHCQDAISTLEEMGISGRMRVIAIDIDEDLETFQASARQMPTKWTPTFALTALEDEELYYFSELPSLYIIDTEGKITAKEPALSSLGQR